MFIDDETCDPCGIPGRTDMCKHLVFGTAEHLVLALRRQVAFISYCTVNIHMKNMHFAFKLP